MGPVPLGTSSALIVWDTVCGLRADPSRLVVQREVEGRGYRELSVLVLAESSEKVGGNKVTPSEKRLYFSLANQPAGIAVEGVRFPGRVR